jgi:CRISPR-associated endonuclease/helicase Cas3
LREVHLCAVASFAAVFHHIDTAKPTNSLAYLASLWHDVGKYRPGFHFYIGLSDNPGAHIEGQVLGLEKTHPAAGELWVKLLSLRMTTVPAHRYGHER